MLQGQNRKRKEKKLRKTTEINNIRPITISQSELPQVLHCGMPTALKMARDAGAEIKIGRRKQYVMKILEDYAVSLAK